MESEAKTELGIKIVCQHGLTSITVVLGSDQLNSLLAIDSAYASLYLTEYVPGIHYDGLGLPCDFNNCNISAPKTAKKGVVSAIELKLGSMRSTICT